MKGCRPLSDSEVKLTFEALKTPRDKALFAVMLYTGFRITEALSLRLEDVTGERVVLSKRNTKGKLEGRDSHIHPDLRFILNSYIQDEKLSSGLLFPSIKNPIKPISRIQAWRIIRPAMPLGNSLGLHSLRKVFAEKMYESLDKDLLKTSKALGHKSIMNTISYLSFKTEELDKAVETIPSLLNIKK